MRLLTFLFCLLIFSLYGPFLWSQKRIYQPKESRLQHAKSILDSLKNIRNKTTNHKLTTKVKTSIDNENKYKKPKEKPIEIAYKKPISIPTKDDKDRKKNQEIKEQKKTKKDKDINKDISSSKKTDKINTTKLVDPKSTQKKKSDESEKKLSKNKNKSKKPLFGFKQANGDNSSKGNNKKKNESGKKKVSFMSAIQTTNKLLQVRGSNRYNAMGKKSKKDSHSIENDLDENNNNSENRIFDVGKRFSSRKSTISRVYSPFKGNKLAKKGISLFIETGFGVGGSLNKFQDRVNIKNPVLTMSQFSKGYIPLRLGFGFYTNKRIFSFALNYTYNYSFGAQSFRSNNLETITNNIYNITAFTESPVTDINELNISTNYFFYQKVTEGIDLIKLYLGLEPGLVLANVTSKYSVHNGNRYRVDGGYSFTDFKKKYADIIYLKGAAKFGVLLRVNHKIHLLSDISFNYYWPILKQVKYKLTTKQLNPTEAASLLEQQLPVPEDRQVLGQQNWINSLNPSMQLSWQLGIRYIL